MFCSHSVIGGLYYATSTTEDVLSTTILAFVVGKLGLMKRGGYRRGCKGQPTPVDEADTVLVITGNIVRWLIIGSQFMYSAYW